MLFFTAEASLPSMNGVRSFESGANDRIRISAVIIAVFLLASACGESISPTGEGGVDTGSIPIPVLVRPASSYTGTETIAGTPDGGYVARGDGGKGLTLFDRQGREVWFRTLTYCPVATSCPTLVDEAGFIYATSRNGLVKFDKAANEVWKVPVAAGSALALASGGRIFASSQTWGVFTQSVFRLDGQTGDIVWEVPYPGWHVDRFLVDELSGVLYAFDGNGPIYALATADGALRWKQDDFCFTGAIGRNGVLYTGCGHPSGSAMSLAAISADGSVKWSSPAVGGGFALAPMIDRDGIVYLAAKSGVTAFHPDGTTKWSYQVEPGGELAFSNPVLDSAGNIYIVERRSALSATVITSIKEGKRGPDIIRADPGHGRSFLLQRDGRVLFNAEQKFFEFASKGFDSKAQWPEMGGIPERSGGRR